MDFANTVPPKLQIFCIRQSGFSQECNQLSDFFSPDVLESVSFLCVILSVPGISIAKLEGEWTIGVEWRNAN